VHASVTGRLDKISFKPGAEVKKGDMLFEVDPIAYRVALDKAEADLESAGVDKKHRDAQLARAHRLKENGSIGSEDYDQITADAAAAGARWKAAKANLDQAKANLAATRVTASVDGVIGQASVGLGGFVNERVTLATITSVDPIRLSFDMDESSFLRYRRLQRAGEVKGIGSPLAMELMDEKGFGRAGTLESFDVRIDPKSGTIRVSGTFPNHDRLLLPGMSARVRMPFGKPRPALQIPPKVQLGSDVTGKAKSEDDAKLQIPTKVQLGSDKGKFWVYVVNKSNTIERRFIKEIFERDDNHMLLVNDGLHADDLIVVEELNGLVPGDKVKPVLAAEPAPNSDK
jgi:RND family efflux transporter MFP subunit